MTSEERKEYSRRYREANKERLKEQRKEYRKKYYSSNREKILSSGKEYRQGHKKEFRKYRKEYSSQHPEYLARLKVSNAIRLGKLAKRPCEVCGSERMVQAHHCDYNKPLDVMWLCKKCHTEWHKNNTPIYLMGEET